MVVTVAVLAWIENGWREEECNFFSRATIKGRMGKGKLIQKRLHLVFCFVLFFRMGEM